MQDPLFDKSTQEEFKAEYKAMVQHINKPSTLDRIARINAMIAAEECESKKNTDLQPPQPVRYFDRLPGETEEELIQRWRKGYMATNAPVDLRVTLDHDSPHEHNGYKGKDAPKPKTIGAFDITPDQIGLPPTTPMSQDLLISRFMPVVPEALRVILDNEAVVMEELAAGPAETEMQTEDIDM